MPSAMLRAVPDSFGGPRPDGTVIDLNRARSQHTAYRDLLFGAGYEVSSVPGDEDCRASAFIEDVAVVLDNIAIICRPGASGRRPEVPPVASALGELMPTVEVKDPGTIDGGDVLRVGRTLFIGKSNRTNHQGLAQFAELASGDGFRVIAVPLHGTIHLKSAVVSVDDESILIAPEYTDPNVFIGLRLIEKPEGEELASVLRLHDDRLVVNADAPQTMGVLTGLGFDVDWVEIGEFQKVGGGVTCLSLLWS